MSSKIKSFRDLKVWQKGVKLVQEIYKITRSFPKEETYGLSSQMRRASISIPSNMAEGFRRRYNKEYTHFLNIALGSCAELETQIVIAKMLGYIRGSHEQSVIDLIDSICRMVTSLKKKLL